MKIEKWSNKKKLEYIHKAHSTARKKLKLFNMKETTEQFQKKVNYNRSIYVGLMEDLDYAFGCKYY